MFRTIIPVPVSNKAPQGETGSETVNDGVNEKTGGAIGGADGVVEGAGGVNDGVIGETVNDTLNDGVNEGVIDGVKKELIKVVKLVKEKPDSNAAEIATGIKKAKPTVERYLRILKVVRIIEFRGAPKTGGYYLTDSILEKIKKA